VKLLGGELQVESELGQGSCFYFSLPFKINTQTVASVNKINLSPSNDIFIGKHVLIADDDEINRSILKHMALFKNEWVKQD
jgi:hypothetical protein